MNYPLEVGGVDDYPVKVGSMLLTLVEPVKGYEQAYNRWYERDHYYAGCMVGPWLYAGSRWVATRELKDRRWPTDTPDGTAVAVPVDRGSYVAIYWVEKGHHGDHFDVWARDQVRWLYANNRGFPERNHVHTVLFDHIGSVYRDPDPVPIDLALDHGYDAIVGVWIDAANGDANALHSILAQELVPDLVAGSGIEIVSSWTPSAGENDPKDVPMDLGSKAGGPERLFQLLFLHGDVRTELERVQAYSATIEREGLGQVRLGAPFLRTIIGTDTYVDQLW